MKIMYKGKLKTLEEIYEEEKDSINPPKFLGTIEELLKLESNKGREDKP